MDINNKKQPIDQSWGAKVIELNKKNGSQGLPNRTPKQTEIDEQPIDIYKPKEEKIPEPIESLPSQEQIQPQKKSSLIIRILKTIGVFIGVFVFVYIFLTFPAQYEKIKYWIGHLGKKEEPQIIELPKNIDTTGSDLFLSTIKGALETDKPAIKPSDTSREQTKQYSTDIADLENNHLIIPKINIKTPIVWNSPPDEDTMMKNLQNGVVHYNGTGLPNESESNVFISGHSSYYWWDKGKYKTIFTNLDKVSEGDEIALAYEDKVYIYRVYEKFEVKPEQVDVLDPVGKPIITLMTCVPVGTNLKRLIIRAEYIQIKQQEEKPSQETTTTPSPTPHKTTATPGIEKSLPSGINPLNIINLLP